MLRPPWALLAVSALIAGTLRADEVVSSSNDSEFAIWEATAPPSGSLGLQLSDGLRVLGFISDARGFAPLLHSTGGVDVGDEIVALNGKVRETGCAAGLPRPPPQHPNPAHVHSRGAAGVGSPP